MKRIVSSKGNSSSANRMRVKAMSDSSSRLYIPANNFIFTQATIVSSIMVESGTHLIKPTTAEYVNANGDTWTNESLRSHYSSFMGSYNYMNHVQEPSKAVGFIADAELRHIVVDKKLFDWIYYVDILVATHRDHDRLVKGIAGPDVEWLSMGCNSYLSQCSRCGAWIKEEGDDCEHLRFERGKYYLDDAGVRRRVAELLGTEDDNTLEFIEASWLTEVPAFGGAAKRNILPVEKDQAVLIDFPREVANKDAIKRYLDQ